MSIEEAELPQWMARMSRQEAFDKVELPFEQILPMLVQNVRATLFRKLETGFVLCTEGDAGAIGWHDRVVHHSGTELTTKHWIKPA